MELDFFKDRLFEALNENDSLNIADIEADDAVGVFTVKTLDGDVFQIECRQIDMKEALKKQIFMNVEEHKKCRKVAEAYKELYEKKDILVLDAGKYGFVKLQYYKAPSGFGKMITFTDSEALFEDLWKEWFHMWLHSLAEEAIVTEMNTAGIFRCLPKERQEELLRKRIYFAEKAGIVINFRSL